MLSCCATMNIGTQYGNFVKKIKYCNKKNYIYLQGGLEAPFFSARLEHATL